MKTLLWTLFWIILIGGAFFRWYTFNHQRVEQPPIDCTQYQEIDSNASWCEQQAEYEQYRRFNPPSDSSPVSSGCTVHCGSGQACGNSCISWNNVCQQPPGRACN